MNKKLYWGLGVLFILIIGGFVFLLVQQKAELAKLKEDFALPTEKVAENENNQKTPQNGHWHGDEWHDEPHTPIVDVADETSQQSEVARSNFSVPGEVEFSQLPKLPADIDPDDIPPFHITEHDGTVYHYNRPLIPEERAMYSTLKSQRKSNPADLKVMAIVFVRQQKAESGTLTPIFQDLIDRKITSEEAEQRIAEFYEMTPAQKGGF